MRDIRLTPLSQRSRISLRDSDARPPAGLPEKDKLKKLLKDEQERLAELQNRLYADSGHAVLVVLQGRDASGKDGTIRNVFEACNPQGCHVTSFKAPTPDELAHDYLWRVHNVTPPRGHIGIFNRSHYEDVLVVRVRNLVPPDVWKTRYDEINAFEKMLSNNRTIVLKFFLHISQDEQRKQLLERLTDPKKNWKFREGDLEDRKLWNDYTAAYRDVLKKCTTSWAPWYLVPSDHRLSRSYLVTKAINERLSALNLRYPRASSRILALKSALKG
jgi:PPK2 family polyphosphate:nucleotide phosphotransferase